MTGGLAAGLSAGLLGLLVIHLAALLVAGAVLVRRIEAAHPPLGRFIAVGGGRMHLYDLPAQAADPGLPVLLLHGATSNARDMLLALGPDLARRHRVLIPDRPGHGWSDRPGGRADADPTLQARLMAELLDRLGVERVVVVGFSWSGTLATALALDHPARIAGLVLLAGVTHPWPGGIARLHRWAAHPWLSWALTRVFVAPLGAWRFGARVDASFTPQRAPNAYAEASAAALILRPRAFAWNGQDVAALAAHVRAHAPRLGTIGVPAAVMAGTADRTVSPVLHAAAAAAAIPGARLTLLEGVGHMLHHVAAPAVLAEIGRVADEAMARPRQLCSPPT